MVDIKKKTKLLKALGEPNRLQILEHLREGDKCACDILELIELSQPALSHHMKILEDVEIVKSVKEGKWVRYSLNPNGFQQIQGIIDELTRP